MKEQLEPWDIWNFLPHISCRQLFMMSFIVINSFAMGLMYGSNIFNFYTPSHYCGYETDSVSKLPNDTVYYCEEKEPNSDLIGNYTCTYFNEKTPFFDEYESIATQFDLTCGRKWLVTLIISLSLVGGIIGTCLACPILCLIPLRDAMIGVRMICGAMFIISSFVTNLPVIVIIRAIIFACDHISNQVYQPAYFIDIVGPDYASMSYIGLYIFSSLGVMSSSGVAYLLPDWRYFYWFTGGFMMLEGVYFLILPHTFQSEYGKGNMASGRKLLKEFSKSLGITIPIKNIQIYERHMVAQNSPMSFRESVVSHIELKYGIFSSGQIRFTSIALSIVTFATMTIFLSYLYLPDGGQFGIHIEVTIGQSIEIAVDILLYFILVFVGRRKLIVLSFSGITLFSILTIIFRSINQPVLTDISDWLDIIGRIPVSALTLVVWMYLAELFPLVVRVRGIALCGFFSKLGQVIAPFVIIGKSGAYSYVHYIVFLVLSTSCIFIVLLLPETAGFSAPVNFEDLQDGADDPDRNFASLGKVKKKIVQILEPKVG